MSRGATGRVRQILRLILSAISAIFGVQFAYWAKWVNRARKRPGFLLLMKAVRLFLSKEKRPSHGSRANGRFVEETILEFAVNAHDRAP